jgi:hypothetical protein
MEIDVGQRLLQTLAIVHKPLQAHAWRLEYVFSFFSSGLSGLPIFTMSSCLLTEILRFLSLSIQQIPFHAEVINSKSKIRTISHVNR